MRLRHLGVDQFGLDIFLLVLETWSDWPASLSLPSAHFRLLTVGDAGRVPDDELARFADAALEAGCALLCAWGPACKRVHTAFDIQDVEHPRHPADSVVMTSDHADESLEDALEFLMVTAWPDEAFEATCHAALIAVVDDGGLADEVRSLARRFIPRNSAN